MKNMIKILKFLGFCMLMSCGSMYATLPSLSLKDVLDACPDIANKKPSKFVYQGLPGTLVCIDGILYEIRNFSYEDTQIKDRQGGIYTSKSFQEYCEEMDYLQRLSVPFSYGNNKIVFESFDVSQDDPQDGIYWTIVMKVQGPLVFP